MELHRILVATDLSDDGRAVVRLGRELAAHCECRLTLCTVEPSRSPLVSGRVASSSDPDAASSPDVARFAAWLGPAAENKQIERPELLVGYGVPGIEITRLADTRGIDLIVAGRRRRTPEHRLLLGDTADGLVRRSERPVLFATADSRSIDRVLIALDGTERTHGVLEAGVGFARATGASVIEAVLVEPERGDEPNALPSARADALRTTLDCHARAQEVARGIPLTVRHGNPVVEILKQTAEAGCDVLVIGYRRGGPPKTVPPTAIARNLLYSAPTAVLTVPL